LPELVSAKKSVDGLLLGPVYSNGLGSACIDEFISVRRVLNAAGIVMPPELGCQRRPKSSRFFLTGCSNSSFREIALLKNIYK